MWSKIPRLSLSEADGVRIVRWRGVVKAADCTFSVRCYFTVTHHQFWTLKKQEVGFFFATFCLKVDFYDFTFIDESINDSSSRGR